MDLPSLLTNKPLLVQLSREFELLKKSGAEVNYEAWVRQRIREAARSVVEGGTSSLPAARTPEAATQGTGSTAAPGAQAAPLPAQPNQLLPSARPGRHTGAVIMGHQVVPIQVENIAGGLVFAGEGLVQQEFASTVKQQATSSQSAQQQAADQAAQRSVAGGNAAQARLRSSSSQEPVFISRLYSEQQAGDVWSQQPEASVQPHYNGPRDQHGRPLRPRERPTWVNAASLQAALRASSAVPHLQAAAERDRRLAVATALAKEQVALGVTGASAAAASREVARAEVEQVLHVAQQIAQQHEGLAKAVQDTHEQLKQHQALLAAALQGRMLPAAAPGAAPEVVPDAWFIRAAQGNGNAGPHQPAAGTAASGPAVGAGAGKAQRKRERKEQLKAALRQLLQGAAGTDMPGRKAPAKVSHLLPSRHAVGAVPDMQRLVQGLLAQRQHQGKAGGKAGRNNAPAEYSPTSSSDTQEVMDKPRRPSRQRPTWDSSPPPAYERHRRHTSPPAPSYRGNWDVEEAAAAAVQQDMAAAHELARIQKLDVLEGRMAELALRLEQQLERTAELHEQSQASKAELEQPQPEQPAPGQPEPQRQEAGEAGAAAPGISVVELHRIMAQLQRMEEQEVALRRKWLERPREQQQGEQPSQPKQPGLLVSDGLVRSLAAPGTQLPQPSAGGASSTDAGSSAAAGVQGPAGPLHTDMVSEAMLESVLEARRHFLRHQQFRDGEMMTTSDPELTPVDIVEDIADILLDELLQQQAEDLLGVCDALGEHLFDSEFSAVV